MATQQRFLGVPDQSKLEVEIEGPEKSFRIAAELRSNGKKIKSWTHSQLTAGKKTHKLKSANRAYSLPVDVQFTNQKTVEVVAKIRIRKPGGGLHSSMKKLTFRGKRNAKRHGRVQIGMKKEG